MHMLCGFSMPSGGDAVVNGHSIVSELGSVRSVLGLCPQHDALYPRLSVKQHLRLYGALKGVAAHALDASVYSIIRDVALEDKADAKAATLSGGQKRKLSLAIAFIGDSQVVILDVRNRSTAATFVKILIDVL